MTTTRPTTDALTAVEILSDGLLRLLRAKPTILPWDQVEPAMVVLGLTRDDLAEARARGGEFITHAVPPGQLAEDDVVPPSHATGGDPGGQPDDDVAPPDPAMTSGQPEDEPEDEPERPPGPAIVATRRAAGHPATTTRKMNHQAGTRARKSNEAGQLLCSRCGVFLDPDCFRLRTDRIGSGQRRSACDPCLSDASRSRYVTIETRGTLREIGITLAIQEGDDAARLLCVDCGQPLGVDDVRTRGEVALVHVVCPE